MLKFGKYSKNHYICAIKTFYPFITNKYLSYMMWNYYKKSDLLKILNSCVIKYEETLGLPDKTVDSFLEYGGFYKVMNQCRIYEKAKTLIFITNTKLFVIPFGKIIGYDIKDLKSGIAPLLSASTTTTKISTGDVVKRAVIGGVLAGGTGALIGGLTASRTTTQDNAHVASLSNYHASLPNLELVINIDDLLSPNLKIPFDEFKNNADIITSILNVIIRRNTENESLEDIKVIDNDSEIIQTGKRMGIEPVNPYKQALAQSDRNEKKSFLDYIAIILTAVFIILLIMVLLKAVL